MFKYPTGRQEKRKRGMRREGINKTNNKMADLSPKVSKNFM